MVKIGRGPDNDIVIPETESTVSWRHATLTLYAGQAAIEDNFSTNGVMVNNVRIPPGRPTPVSPDAVVMLGAYRLIIDRSAPKIAALFAAADEKLRDGRITIGRDAGHTIVIPAPDVSGLHCQIASRGGRLFVRDFSKNGTYLNSLQNRVPPQDEAPLQPGDVIYAASRAVPPEQWFELLRLACGASGGARAVGESRQTGDEETIRVTPPPAAQRFLTRLGRGDGKAVRIGRLEDNDIVIREPVVSGHHAVIRQEGERVFLEDLGSTNGTFVDGRRIKGRVEIDERSEVRLASQQLRLDFSQLRNQELLVVADGAIQLDVGELLFQVRDRANPGRVITLLDEVSLSQRPGEMTAIMGPSGCGKTTLLYSLIGSQPPTCGQVLYNGQNLYDHYDAFRTSIGYVPQDDILFPQLTVYESLYYVCKLRLPPETTDAEINQRIDNVLRSLGFDVSTPGQDVRAKLIGSPEKKVLSGGQRKRVNIAQELITNPKILFLDEPTSGLASKDAKEVIRLLKGMAERDRVSVILTIHQPSFEVYSMFTHALLLAPGGCLAYYGSAEPGSFQYFKTAHHNPDELLECIDVKPPQNQMLKERFKQDVNYRINIVERQRQISGCATSVERRSSRIGLRQFFYLTSRNLTLKMKDVFGGTGILLLQAPIIALLVLGAFYDETQKTEQIKILFLLAVSAIWFGCNNSAREIVAERVIYLRERMVNLKIPSYLLSKVVTMTVLCALQCLVLLAVNYHACNLNKLESNFLVLYGVLLVTALAGVCLGVLLSTLVKTNEAAVGAVPILLLPQVILAGMLVPLKGGAMKALAALTLSRWSYEALLDETFAGDAPFIKQLNFTENQAGADLTVLAVMIVGFLAVAMAILYVRDIHSLVQKRRRRTTGA
jgi:ABC-type multidrug transport system ATPase subunit